MLIFLLSFHFAIIAKYLIKFIYLQQTYMFLCIDRRGRSLFESYKDDKMAILFICDEHRLDFVTLQDLRSVTSKSSIATAGK